MRKLFLFTLLVALVLAVAFNAEAADKARSGSQAVGLNYVNGLGDVSSGDCAEIDTNGALRVQEYGNNTIATNLAFKTGADDGDGAIVSAACRVSLITITGVSAGDWAEIIDGTDSTGTIKFDPKIGTAEDTTTISIPGGASFATGVYVNAVDGDVLVSVTYN